MSARSGVEMKANGEVCKPPSFVEHSCQAKADNKLFCSGKNPNPSTKDSSRSSNEKVPIRETVLTLLLSLGCVIVSLFTDTFSKQFLTQNPDLPVTLTVAQFAMSSLCGFCLLHILRLHPAQPIKWEGIRIALPISVCQASAFLLTNVGFGRLAVSFAHTVKASESLFTAFLAAVFLSKRYSPSVVISLLVMVLGVGMSAMAEASFNMGGFISAVLSNLAFALMNVISTKAMSPTASSKGNGTAEKKSVAYDGLNLHWILCCLSFVLLSTIAWGLSGEAQEVSQSLRVALSALLDPQAKHKAIVTLNKTKANLFLLSVGGTGHYIFNLFSFLVLERTSPLTHVVMNTVRRVIVIVFSAIYWQTPLEAVNICGIITVFAGVASYTLETSQGPSKRGRNKKS